MQLSRALIDICANPCPSEAQAFGCGHTPKYSSRGPATTLKKRAGMKMKNGRLWLIALLLGVFTVLPVQAQIVHNDKPKREFTVIEKASSIFAGVVLGGFSGAVIGTLLGDSRAYNGEFADIMRGVLIGGSVGPFLIYEDWARKKGVRFPMNTWYVVSGGNVTFSNYEAADLRLGFSGGIGRNYRLSDKVYLQGEASYNHRGFLLPSQRIFYGYFGRSELWHGDVNFSVAYIDIALLTKVRVATFDKARLHMALGSALSAQVLEKNDYNIWQREDIENFSSTRYDFAYIDDEPGPTDPFVSLKAAIELEAGKLLLKASLSSALYNSDQIFPLINETRLHTLVFSAGYRFAK